MARQDSVVSYLGRGLKTFYLPTYSQFEDYLVLMLIKHNKIMVNFNKSPTQSIDTKVGYNQRALVSSQSQVGGNASIFGDLVSVDHSILGTCCYIIMLLLSFWIINLYHIQMRKLILK